MNISGQLLLDGSETCGAHPDTLRSSQIFSVESGTLFKPGLSNVGTQIIFAVDGTWLGVTSRLTRPGDLLIRHGSFDSDGLEMERYLVLLPKGEKFRRCDVVGQAATLALVVPPSTLSFPTDTSYVEVYANPEDLIVYYVQSLIPPERNHIDWIFSRVATRFSKLTTKSYAVLTRRENQVPFAYYPAT